MKKAKIDVLDIAESLEANPEIMPDLESLAVEEPQIDLQNESFLVAHESEKPPVRRLWTWKAMLFLGIPAFCVVLVAVAIAVYFLPSDKKAAPAVSKDAMGRPISGPAGGAVYFDHLTAVVNDSSGNQRLVMFGIAVTPAKGAGLNFSGSDQSVRFAAARVVGDLPLADVMHEGGRDRVKKRIKAHVEYFKGSGTIDSVWITSWTIL